MSLFLRAYRVSEFGWMSVHGSGFAEPIAEPRRTDVRFGSRDERLVVQLRAEVASMRIRDDLTGILAGNEDLPGQLIQWDGLRPCHFNRVVERLPKRDVGKRLHNLVRHDRLHERRRYVIDVAVERAFRDPFDEFEELRRFQDGVGN